MLRYVVKEIDEMNSSLLVCMPVSAYFLSLVLVLVSVYVLC